MLAIFAAAIAVPNLVAPGPTKSLDTAPTLPWYLIIVQSILLVIVAQSLPVNIILM
jgi:hypothetical protein